MGKFIFAFSGTLALLHASLSFVLGKFPNWVSTNIIGPDSKLGYLLKSELAYDLFALGIAIALFPPILYLCRELVSLSVRLLFHSGYCLAVRKKKVAGIALTASLLFAAFGVGCLVQGLGAYGFALAREYKSHEEINRQRLLEKANNDPDVASSIRIIQNVVRIYPDDERNRDLEAYTQRYSNAKEASNRIVSVAEAFAEKSNPTIALRYYMLAADVFKENKIAAARINAYREELAAAKPALLEFFQLCRNPSSLRQIISNVDRYVFAVKDASSIRKIKIKADEEEGVRLHHQLCSDALKRPIFEEYLTEVEQKLFAAQSEF